MLIRFCAHIVYVQGASRRLPCKLSLDHPLGCSVLRRPYSGFVPFLLYLIETNDLVNQFYVIPDDEGASVVKQFAISAKHA